MERIGASQSVAEGLRGGEFNKIARYIPGPGQIIVLCMCSVVRRGSGRILGERRRFAVFTDVGGAARVGAADNSGVTR